MSTGVAHIYQKEFVPLAEALLDSSEPATLFDDFRDKQRTIERQHEIHPLREILIAAVGECLNHEEYKIGANAAVVLRRNMILCRRACDLNDVVSALSQQVNENRIQPAKEAALSLAYFLSTRPNDRKLPQWDGADPMPSSSTEEGLDQNRFVTAPAGPGYLYEVSPEIAETAIDSLIQNLDRKEYKRSTDWVVAKECAKALGTIGYQRPALVANSVPKIQKLLEEQDDRQAWLVYALTSIGYSRPDLIGDDVDVRLKEFSEEAGLGASWQLKAVADVGYRKIGHAPIYLEKKGCDPNSDLSEIVDKLSKFMLGRYPSSPEGWRQAFVEIYRTRPEELVTILNDELDQILEGESRGRNYPENFALLLSNLASVDAKHLQPLIGRSTDFYRDHSESHNWYEEVLDFHRHVASEDEQLLPDDIDDVVIEFLESESRHSILTHGRSFLQEIDQWDEELMSTKDANDMDLELIEDLDDEDMSLVELLEENHQEE